MFYADDDDLPEARRDDIQFLHPWLKTIAILQDQFNGTIAGLKNSEYAMKPFAALASSFDRVILIDADSIFLQSPDAYFEENSDLNKTGLLFFHDRGFKGRETRPWIRKLMQSTKPSPVLNESMYWQNDLEHQQESGVVFINKMFPSAFMSLSLTAHMNTKSLRPNVYSHVAGKYLNLHPSQAKNRNLHMF